MVTIGKTYEIQGELYEVVRTLKIKPNIDLDSDMVESAKLFYKVDKIFKNQDTLYFVNHIQEAELELDEDFKLSTT